MNQKPFFDPEIEYVDNFLYGEWVSCLKLLPQGTGFLLDIGCGEGSHIGSVKNLGYNWMGLDIIKTEATTVVADAYKLPFSEGCFDVVLINQVLEHLYDPLKALKCMNEILKRGGMVVGSVSFLEPFHESYFNLSHWGLEQILKEAGFRILKIALGVNQIKIFLHFAFFRILGLGTLLSKWSIMTVSLYLKIRRYLWEKFKNKSLNLDQYPLRFAGHIMFLAQKQ